MKVYIQSYKNGLPHNVNFFSAYDGFADMGAETVPFCTIQELSESNAGDIVVGYVDMVRDRLSQLGFTTPEIDYPDELSEFLGRKIWTSHINTINNHPEYWPIFIKSVEDKRISGRIIRSIHDLMGCGESGCNAEIYCSEIVNFVAEWRVFVKYGKILDVRPYKGDWKKQYDPNIIDSCIQSFKNMPAGCGIDFGVTDDNRTILIEVNDGYALGCYGLNKILYAKLLSARWSQLTDTVDPFNF